MTDEKEPLTGEETSFGAAGLSASAILHDAPWIVEDTRFDQRALAYPLVAGELEVRLESRHSDREMTA